MNWITFFAIFGAWFLGIADMAIWKAMMEDASAARYAKYESMIFTVLIMALAWAVASL